MHGGGNGGVGLRILDTLGNVLQLVSIGAAVVGMWVNMDKRITAVELRESYSLEERRDMKKSLQTLTETQATLARTVAWSPWTITTVAAATQSENG